MSVYIFFFIFGRPKIVTCIPFLVLAAYNRMIREQAVIASVQLNEDKN